MAVTQFSLNLLEVAALLLTVLGMVGALLKWMLAQHQRHHDAQHAAMDKQMATNQALLTNRMDSLDQASRNESAQWQRVERELMALKADMPLNYVRREDYIRGQSVIEAKLDGLAVRLENVQLRDSVRNGGRDAN